MRPRRLPIADDPARARPRIRLIQNSACVNLYIKHENLYIRTSAMKSWLKASHILGEGDDHAGD
jgi:hypothetical protein